MIGAPQLNVKRGLQGQLLLPCITLPLLAISKLIPLTFEGKDCAVLNIRAKDFRCLHLLFVGLLREGRYSNYKNALKAIEFYATPNPQDGFASIFAFKYQGRTSASTSGAESRTVDSPVRTSTEPSTDRGASSCSAAPIETCSVKSTMKLMTAARMRMDIPPEDSEQPLPLHSALVPSLHSANASDSDLDEDASDDDLATNSSNSASVTPRPMHRAVHSTDSLHSSHTNGMNESPRVSQRHRSESPVHCGDSPVRRSDSPVGASAVNNLPQPLIATCLPFAVPLHTEAHFAGWDLFDPIAEFARMGSSEQTLAIDEL